MVSRHRLVALRRYMKRRTSLRPNGRSRARPHNIEALQAKKPSEHAEHGRREHGYRRVKVVALTASVHRRPHRPTTHLSTP